MHRQQVLNTLITAYSTGSFGDNDIKNLPLVSNGERITYNGLKAYLRELEKGGYKYVVKIFDRKGDYQSFISNYGIYESAWEIVRGINKTEDM